MDRAAQEDKVWKLAPTSMPNAPSGMLHVAREEWDRIGRYLLALDRVSDLDKQTLYVYCTQWAIFSRIMHEELSDRSVKLYEDGSNCEVQHSMLRPLLRSAEIIIKKAGEFGLTARTRDLGSDHGNRKSSTIKRLMGNRRKVAEHKLEDNVLPLLPDWDEDDMLPPSFLNAKATEEFYELGDQLKVLDLFTPLDVSVLSVGCCLYELYDRCIEQLHTLYTTVYSQKGEEIGVKEHPLLKVMTDLHPILQYVWKDYGQTPRFRQVFDGEKKEETKDIPLVFKGKFG